MSCHSLHFYQVPARTAFRSETCGYGQLLRAPPRKGHAPPLTQAGDGRTRATNKLMITPRLQARQRVRALTRPGGTRTSGAKRPPIVSPCPLPLCLLLSLIWSPRHSQGEAARALHPPEMLAQRMSWPPNKTIQTDPAFLKDHFLHFPLMRGFCDFILLFP